MQSQKDNFSLRPIGVLKTVFDHKFGTPRQGALAPSSLGEFELNPEWRGKGVFCGLEGFSHVWLLSVFHQNRNTRQAGKIHPPRLLGEAIGVFASRSPHRPNPIGLTLARIESVEGDQLKLSGVDLVDGTPILDIKPYLGEADRPAEFSSGWAEKIPANDIRCEFESGALEDLAKVAGSSSESRSAHLRKLIEEVLQLDPRPLAYRKRVNERFAIVLDGLDVHARYNEGVFTVIEVKPFVASAKGPLQSVPLSQVPPQESDSHPTHR